MKRILKREEGQALVEFALILPLLLLLVCGILDFGWLFYNQLSLQNACREGARFACVNSTDADIDVNVSDKVKENVPENLKRTQAQLTSTVTYSDTAAPTSGNVTVKVTAKLQFITPVLGMIYRGSETTLNSEVIMKVES